MKIILLLYCYFTTVRGDLINTHINKRARLLEKEAMMSIGGTIELDDKEKRLNNKLMQWKFQEVDYAFDNPEYFNFSQNFFVYRDNIKKSKVYQFIKTMPKGAALHVHSSSLLGPDYLLNITYKDHLYVCFDKNINFKFAESTPRDNCNTKWNLMSDIRKLVNNVTKFDMEIQKNFALVDNDGENTLDENSVWKQFNKIFATIYPLVSYRPVWEEYFYDALNKVRNDNIMYVEIRCGFPELYELNGTTHDPLFFGKTSYEVLKKFIKDYTDFFGAKMIYSIHRNVGPARVAEALVLTKEMKRILPDFIAGFDLVGQEDLGEPLVEFLPELTAAKKDLDYFFHAGETDWYGTFSDENLVDAVVLGAKRIGHAYALLKHPILIEEVKKRDICLEVNIISNTVLTLVRDVRNHPLASFIAQGLPVVLSSDDPGLWEADPISMDFYVSFVGVASRLNDLRLLKKFALNSIRYSSLSTDRKKVLLDMFNARWETFISESLEKELSSSAYYYTYNISV